MYASLLTPPSTEPVTLDEVKNHCRIDNDDEDSLITFLITSSRRFCENYCKRAFINQTWRLTYDVSDFDSFKKNITLPFGNIQSITSVKSYDSDNVSSVFSTDNYRLSNNRIVLNDNSDWPTFDRFHDGLEIIYVAGFGSTSDDVPTEIRHAILMTVAHYFENREAITDSISAQQSTLLPMGVSALLQPHRIYII